MMITINLKSIIYICICIIFLNKFINLTTIKKWRKSRIKSAQISVSPIGPSQQTVNNDIIEERKLSVIGSCEGEFESDSEEMNDEEIPEEAKTYDDDNENVDTVAAKTDKNKTNQVNRVLIENNINLERQDKKQSNIDSQISNKE